MHSKNPRQRSHLYCMFVRAIIVSPSMAVVCMAGCGGGTELYPVNGKVQWKGGGAATELANYNISLQSADRKSSGGIIQPDGSFSISTLAENDGAVVGKHRVAISPPEAEIDIPAPRPILAARYGSFETSGLEIEVNREPNNVTLEVERR